MTAQKPLTGRIAPDRIHMHATPKPPAGAVDRFLTLGPCSGTISDIMDELGIPAGVIGCSTLRPTIPGSIICGPAITMRNIRQRIDVLTAAKAGVNKMAEFETHNLSEDGDVLVIQGVSGASNMGGIGARIGKRQGQRGAIVWGAVRDVPDSRGFNYPIWSTEVIPATGKWRLETVEINGAVDINGIKVMPGDLVFADDTGVCFVPRDRIMDVLEACEARTAKEDAIVKQVDDGAPVPDIMPVKKPA